MGMARADSAASAVSAPVAPGLAIAPAETAERALRRLEWRVIRRLDGRMPGDFRTLLYGGGTDVADLREYELGDDVRHIDWNVTARMDTPFVRTYHEDRELTAWLLLDRSASMGFGPSERSKEHVLIDLATTLTRLLTRGGNRVGAILFNSSVEFTVPPKSGRIQSLRVNRHLAAMSAVSIEPPKKSSRRLRSDSPSAAAAGMTRLTDLVTAATYTIKRRSLIVIISDFISEPGWEGPLGVLNQRHEVVAIRLFDPRERELPDVGQMVIEDAETGELVSVDTTDAGFRYRFAAAVAEHEEALRQSARRAGVELYSVSTEDDLVSSLVRIVELRRRRRG
jgi:uncharacterized protein (DUF58 family)